jgi:hypothetical protein
MYAGLDRRIAMADDRAKQAAQLTTEITALRAAIASLVNLTDARRPLEALLAAKERELAALRGEAPPATRSHSQTLGGGAKVGAASAGDVYGSVSSTNQSGGVNFGSGNQIGSVGDIVAGDKVGGDKNVSHGPQIAGPITSGRDTNVATDMTINNTEPPEQPAPRKES